MRYALLLIALAGCPGGDENPAKLWLALDGSETEVKLVDIEPHPY
jgi:hypothetical protein